VLKGLIQGDILSPFLSDIYYGHMTQHRLGQFLVAPPGTAEIMLRGMDDFLFISTHRDRVQEFLRVVEAGFPDYGTVFRQDKTRSNLGMLPVSRHVV
jgi:Reverse transcriptase (RNA-dependent DNA polymerase)